MNDIKNEKVMIKPMCKYCSPNNVCYAEHLNFGDNLVTDFRGLCITVLEEQCGSYETGDFNKWKYEWSE